MAHKHEHTTLSTDSVARGHETSDVDPKSVAISGILLSLGLVFFAILLSAGVYVMFKAKSPDPNSPARTLVVTDSTMLPPLPRLQADPHITLVPFVKMQDSLLASYGWVMRDSGIARIPIERAMKLVVERGLPVQSK
ncbi:MAG: hypothetical protein ABI623_10470 [bacterium]